MNAIEKAMIARTPHEATTENEKLAYAYGWWQAIEYMRAQESTRSEKLRESGYTKRPRGWEKDEEPES